MEPTTTAAAAGGGMNGLFFIMIAFLAVFMFLSSRSQKKKDATQQKMIKALQKGDQVILIGGIVGTVAGFNNEIIEVKLSESSKVSVLPNGIMSVYKNQNANEAVTGGGSK